MGIVPRTPGGSSVGATSSLEPSSNRARAYQPRDGSERLSMPFFVHPRAEVSLEPLPGCVARTGGAPRYEAITAGGYLSRRLEEIGLGRAT